VPTSTAGPQQQVVVIGAGPAGLTAAYELGKADVPATVLEASDVVGGISRTVERDGWRFDIGGHRFFTKVPEVEALWHEILPDDEFLLRPRMSRIYYRVRVRPPQDQSNFEGWSPHASGGACTASSSRPTPRRCGGCRPPRSRPTGPPSGSRTSRCPAPS